MSGEVIFGDAKNGNGNSQTKWVVSAGAAAILAASAMWVMGVANGSAEALRRIGASETRQAVMEAKVDAKAEETNRRLESIERMLRSALSDRQRTKDGQ